MDNIVTDYDDLFLSLSYSLKTAQEHINELKGHIADYEGSDLPAGHEGHVHVPITTPKEHKLCKLDTPVSVLNIYFEDITTDEAFNSFNFTDQQSCGRQTAYFGKHPYVYGRVKHDPQPYPDIKIFNYMFGELGKLDNTFNKENFSCLVTLYKDGAAHIPPHQDNKLCIKPGSNIYTVSLGATRNFKCTNINDLSNKLEEYNLELKHGMIFSMSQESQHICHHSIDRDSQVKSPRVSFTFRHTIPLKESDNTLGRQGPTSPIPPISHPDVTAPETMKRVLLLTE